MEKKNPVAYITYSALIILFSLVSIAKADAEPFGNKRSNHWKTDKYSQQHFKDKDSYQAPKESTRDYFKRKLYKEPDITGTPIYKNPDFDKRRHQENKYQRHDKNINFRDKFRDREVNRFTPIPETRHNVSSHTHDRHGPRHDYRIYDRHRHIYYRTPWYNTYYLAPIRHRYYPFGYRIRNLPGTYIRVVVGTRPYFYSSGVYYSSVGNDYVVVRAPIGAFVEVLPEGFIAFSLGLITYYYVNDTYYNWDDVRQGYTVVEKPQGAEQAMETATSGRLFVYPNKGQSEKQQAEDRYECHRWAVNTTSVDPSGEDIELSEQERSNYKRAISACLVAKDYTVK